MRCSVAPVLLVLFWLVLGSDTSAAKVTTLQEYVMETPASVTIPGDVPIRASQKAIQKRGIRILVFGDGGTGDENQMKVAATMQKFCEKNECDFALMLGDNINPRGVQSINDPQFIEKFEKPYADLGIPVFAVLGEHDWGRDGEMYNWRAQIDYTKVSPSWRMPSDIYSVTLANLKIFALNTNVLPESKEQIDWLRKELECSTAKWNVVIGHKPIHSYGYHGDIDFMVAELLPVLCGRADLYMSGHEHNRQVLRADCGLPLVVSSAAGKVRTHPAEGRRSLFASTDFGFAYLQVGKKELTIEMISKTGDVQYALVVH